MSIMYSHALKYTQGDLVRTQEMDHSNIGDPQKHCHHQHNSGLMLTTTINHHHGEDHQHHYIPTTSSEMEAMFAKLISPNNNILSSSEPLKGYGGGRAVKKEEGDKGYNNFGSNNESHMIYQHHHHEQIQGLQNGSMNGFHGSSFNAVNSMNLENNNTQAKMSSASANYSNLIRQKSSPAGFFSYYSVDNGFRARTSSTSSGMDGTLNFTARPSYCNIRMPHIVESGSEGLEPNCVENNRNLVENDHDHDNGNNKSYMQSFTTDHFWDGSAFNGSKTANGNREITFSTSKIKAQGSDFGYQKLGLTHHLSLPSSSTKMGGIMNKPFQIQGSVPCKIRAKRGFATHPRSIAERERRTRISERIKKLQDLFPKSDKQTSTADMLDLAVEYIKDLQKQVKILKDSRAWCTCSSNQKQ